MACPHCEGSGFVRRDVAIDHPDFGQALPCSCVLNESKNERQTRLLRYSNLGQLARHRFDTLVRRGRSGVPEHQDRFEQAVATAESFADSPEGWLVLCGPSGSGKTHLAAALAHRLIEQGSPVLFMVVPDLLDHLRAAYAPGAEVSYDRLFEMVRNAPVLVLDDLGVQSPTAWADEKLYQLINHRYNTGAPTVITMARPLERLDERLRSRLGDERLARILTLEGGVVATSQDDGLAQPLLRSMTFHSFDTKDMSLSAEARALVENGYKQALRFAQEPEGWLVFYGGHGAGKTHLAAAIANARREAGRPVLFQVVPDLLDHLRSSFQPDSPIPYDELFERLRSVPLLVLDDLGAHPSSPWAREKLYQIVNFRYNGRLPTVFTLGDSVDELDERLAARLGDPRIATRLWLIAPDHRSSSPGEGDRGVDPRGRRRPPGRRR